MNLFWKQMKTFLFFRMKVNSAKDLKKKDKTPAIRRSGRQNNIELSRCIWCTPRPKNMGLFDLKELLFFYGIISITSASQSITYKDTVLTGPVIRTLLNIDWFQCLELCLSTPECLSYNFCTRNNGVCELNKCSVDAVKCGQNKALRHKKHCVFHHFKENQVCEINIFELGKKFWYIVSNTHLPNKVR